MMKTQQRGFTLIELVVVITILGILAAFALPRFAGLETQARIATVNGMAGGMRSAAALAHALQLASGLSAGAPVSMEGQTVTMINGYPTEDAAGILAALIDTSGFNCDADADCTATGGTTDQCTAIYPASAAGEFPAISTNTSAC